MKSRSSRLVLGFLATLVASIGHSQVNVMGDWGPVITWPHVPVSAANLPDGRILTWASNEQYAFPNNAPEYTFTGIFDPATGIVTEIDHDGHDMFCAHQVMLEDGQVFVSGGRNSGNSPWTSVFDYQTDSWIQLNNMNRGRWYPTSVVLPDGSVTTAIGSGGGGTAESYDPDSGSWSLETGVPFQTMVIDYSETNYNERRWWPLLHLAPDGRIFHSGPTPKMHWINTSGVGSVEPVNGTFTDWYTKHGTTVMYDEGKLLTAGGWVDGSDINATNRALTIDISGATPNITEIAPMQNARKFHNGVMLPNGEVLVIGGNTDGEKFDDQTAVLGNEIWNPGTGQWRWVATMGVPRTYHSIALLLPDARVLSAGGGLCGCVNDHPDGQIYSPPYLFDSNGNDAIRPVITGGPNSIRPGDSFGISTDSTITEFSMIRMSSTTHAVNTDLRYLKVPFSGSSGSYQLTASANANVLLPGYWMLFALNSDGTPSEARVLQVRSSGSGETPQTSMDLNYNNLAELSAFQVNPDASGVGSVLRLTDGTNQAGSAFYATPAIISAGTSFSTRLEFEISGSGNGGDGMAFLLQGNDPSALGSGGSGLGYGGIGNSLVIELDNDDDASGDPNDNHIAVHVGGDEDAPLATATAPFDLEDGNPHVLWVDYDGASDLLKIYLSENVTQNIPSTPVLTVSNLNLLATVGSPAYFGFTAGTSSKTNDHDVRAWSLAVGAGGEPLVVNPVVAVPQSMAGPVTFSASATGTGVEYRWSFGDGSQQTLWSSDPIASHTYPGPQRYPVTLTVRDVNGNEQEIQFVQAVHPPLTAERPKSSNGLLTESVTGPTRVWNVNPDNDSVTVINAANNTKLAEITVGQDPRSMALASDGRIWVVNKDSASISIIDTGSLSVDETRLLAPGSRPHGVVIDDSADFAYVTLEALGRVLKLRTNIDQELANLDVGPNPRHLSLNADRDTVYVTRFITPLTPGEETTNPSGTGGGEVLEIDAGSMTVTDTIVLNFSFDQPSEQTGPGVPNYLGPAMISPSGLEGWVPSKQDNILLGASRPSSTHLSHDQTVRAVTSVFNVLTGLEDTGLRVDHDNASIASYGDFGPYGVYLFNALEGNRQVAVVDVFGKEELFRFDVGFAPQSVEVSEDGDTLYVHNFLDRSITVVDISGLINGGPQSVTILATVGTVGSEQLASNVLQGKKFFYDARDSRLAFQSYMSCASCHNDGGHDGRVWDFKGFGEGLRNTISLEGHAGVGQGRLHWTGNFDEVHDFENQIRGFTLGLGLMSDPDFTANEPTLGTPKAGLSDDLDDLSDYVTSLSSFGRSPYRDPSGALTAAGEIGKTVFENTDCASCHSGPGYTDSSNTTELFHDIGTLKPSSGERMGGGPGSLTGLDTPTLKGLWATAPYLHDGSAATIRAAVEAHSTASLGGVILSSQELDDLSEYLMQVDDLEFGELTPFQQEPSGRVVMEAEHFHANVGGGGVGPWLVTGVGGASGGQALKSPTTVRTFPPNSPRAEFETSITVAGDFYVWVRFRSFTDGSDSAYVEIDNLGEQSVKLRPFDGAWHWAKANNAYTLDAGLHTVKLWRREKDAEIDQVLITPDAGYVPTGIEPESPQGGGGGNWAPVLADINDESVVEDGNLTINLSATDSNGDNLAFSESGLPSFAVLTDNGDGTASIFVAPQVGDAGTYSVDIFVDDDGSPSMGDSDQFTLTVTDGTILAFQQDPGTGRLVMEAEHFHANAGGGGVGPWAVITDAGAADGEALKSPTAVKTFPPNSPRADYETNFVLADSYYVWVRFRSFNTGSDSAYVEIDDLGEQSVKLDPPDSSWHWARANNTYTLGVGAHTVKMWRREKDAEIDQVLITSDAGYTPAGTETESPQGGGGGNWAPVLAPIGDQSAIEGGNLTINLSATDGNGDDLVFSETGLPAAFAVLTDNGDGTASIFVAPQTGDSGIYPVEVFVDDDGSPSMGDSEQFTLTVTDGTVVYFQQDAGSGLLVMEAEHFHANAGGGGVGPWAVISDGSASDGEALKSPTVPRTTPPSSPRADYESNLVTVGSYYVWVRFKSFTDGSDSAYVEIDNLGEQSVKLRPFDGTWHWAKASNPYSLGVGAHTVKLWRREKDAEIDKIVITSDAGYTPTGAGPAETL